MAKGIFWSGKRLRELRSKARHLDLPQLAKHFKKTEDSVSYALEYSQSLRAMRLCTYREVINGKSVIILKLKPGYARYSISLTELFE